MRGATAADTALRTRAVSVCDVPASLVAATVELDPNKGAEAQLAPVRSDADLVYILVLKANAIEPPRTAKEPEAELRGEYLHVRVPGRSSRATIGTLAAGFSPGVRDLLAEALRAHGSWVVEARDGEDAQVRLDAHPGIDLVVTDVDRPRRDGIGLLQRIRARGPRRAPVVIVSMRGSVEDQRRALAAGADAYLVKTDLSHAGLRTLPARLLA